jgi:hypothetical protein
MARDVPNTSVVTKRLRMARIENFSGSAGPVSGVVTKSSDYLSASDEVSPYLRRVLANRFINE